MNQSDLGAVLGVIFFVLAIIWLAGFAPNVPEWVVTVHNLINELGLALGEALRNLAVGLLDIFLQWLKTVEFPTL